MNQNNPIQEELKSYEEQRKELVGEKNRLVPFLFLFPVLVFIITALFTSFPPILIGSTAISIILSVLFYQHEIGQHFSELKTNTRKALIEEFMKTYHPEVNYFYSADKLSVRNILDGVSLIRADRYKEEDVIYGQYQGSDFYFSEIHLQDESKDKDGHTSTSTIFKGILFEIIIPDRNFPKTRIQSRRRLLQMLFSDFVEDKEHGFWYETEDEYAYQETMQSLLPFISHLKHQQGDIRLQAEGDKITLMMESKMKFLDDPKQSIEKPLDSAEYKSNMAQQLNTLLFIVDSFVNDLNNTEIVERLELQALEIAENRLRNTDNA